MTHEITYHMLFITVNAEILMVTIFCGLNFHGDKFSWVRVACHNYCCSSFVSTIFRGLIFVCVACPQKLIPNKTFCV